MASEVAAMTFALPERGEEDISSPDSAIHSPPDGNDNPKSSPQSGKPACTALSASDPKICGVCGDKALGNNFNAVTCESCKAFFRRNALRTKEFVCPFNSACNVDAVTRRFCQRCRLKKCFDIGMKKEWIMTDEEKQIKKQKIEQNRKKRTSLENAGAGGTAHNNHASEDGPASKVHVTEAHISHHSASALQVPVHSTEVDPPPQNKTNHSKPPKQGKPMRPRNHKSGDSTNQRKLNDSIVVSNINPPSPAEFVSTLLSSPSAAIDPHHLSSESLQQSFHHSNHPEQPHWIQGAEGDSSSSNSSIPSTSPASNLPLPIMKHGPNKKHMQGNVYNMSVLGKSSRDAVIKAGVGVDEDGANHQMPLLSWLIRPGQAESSPDHNNSPPSATATPDNDSDDGPVPLRNEMEPVDYHLPPQNHSQAVMHHDNHIEPQEIQYQRRHVVTSSYEYLQDMYRDVNGNRANMNNGTTYHDMKLAAPLNSYEDKSAEGHTQRNQQNGVRVVEQEITPLPLNTMDSILSVAIAAEFNAFGMLGASMNSKELNKAEQAKLNELLLASQALHAPVDAERPVKETESSDPSLLNVINLTEIAIRRLIKMSKKISGFKNMCQEDQIALLKGSCTEMMILRSVVTYDPDRDSWQIPHSNPGYNINLGVLKEARGNLYEEHQRFVKSFRALWRKDENIMIIMCAISLFTPERPNVIHKDVVKLEQDSYYYLLKRYLESIWNGCEAKSTYLQLIRKIAELRALNSSHVRVFLEMNPREVEPLLIEIFDLK